MFENEETKLKEYKTILDLGLKLSSPFNNDINLIKQIIPLKAYIDSLYLPLHFKVFPFPESTGKINHDRTDWKGFKDKKQYDELLLYIILKLKQNNIKTRLLLNSFIFDFQEVLGRWPHSKLFKNLKYFCSNSDLEHVTVANLLLAIKINRSFPRLKITISTNAFINNFERLNHWLKNIDNLEGVTLDIKINKNLEIIRDIKRYSKLKITLINESCFTNCPNRETHAVINDLRLSQDYINCRSQIAMKPWLAYSSCAIVPYNLRFYKGILDCLKIIDRRFSTERLISSLKHYIFNINSREYLCTDAFPGEEPRGVFQKVSTCNRHCDQCNYCYNIWKKINHIPDDYIYIVRGLDYQKAGEFKKALAEYDKVKNRKYLCSLYVLKHDCYRKLKKYSEAIDAWKQAVRLASDKEEIDRLLRLYYKLA